MRVCFGFGESLRACAWEWGRGGGVTSWVQSAFHGEKPAADEMLAGLMGEFSLVIDICTG